MNRQLPLQLRWERSPEFAQYYPGSNVEAVNQVKACAQATGDSQVYIWAPHGSGKTHLLQAACRECNGHNEPAIYLPLSQLTGSLPVALENLEQFALVCLDELDSICGDEKRERAIFNLFNRLRDRQTRLLVAAQRAPSTLGLRLPDLASRLAWGLVYGLHPLDDQQLLLALQARAACRGFKLSTEIGRYLLHRLPRDPAALFQLLDRLDQASLAAQRKLTIPFVKYILDESK